MDPNVMPASIVSVNISEKQGEPKTPVNSIQLDDKGTLVDAACCRGHYQLCMFPEEELLAFNEETNKNAAYGHLGEHLTIKGLDFQDLAPFDQIKIGEVIFEVTRKANPREEGEEDIIETLGCYRLPKGSVLVRVVKGGIIRPGMGVDWHPKVFKTWIITLSDRISRGEMDDFHGPKIKNLMSEFYTENNWKHDVELKVMADDQDSLRFILRRAKEEAVDLVVTLGGTGIGPRDITPDVVMEMSDKLIPGIMENLRMKFSTVDKNALLSRGVAGIIGETIAITLPGSVSVLNDYMEEVFKLLKHIFYMKKGLDLH